METKISGIECVESENYSVFYIVSFSDELKAAIRENLSAICHGAVDAESGGILFDYKATIKEFVKRYKKKSQKTKVGMIGELLLHLVFRCYFDDYEIDSLYFNLEEHSIKKGFDIVLNQKHTKELWIAEVKSGELHDGKNVAQTSIDLLSDAKEDLFGRLNGDSSSLWINAVHHARIAIHDNRTEKAAIISLLQEQGGLAASGKGKSQDTNVILAGIVFNPLDDKIDVTKIAKKQINVQESNCFKKVYVVAMQKETFDAVYAFLESEGK